MGGPIEIKGDVALAILPQNGLLLVLLPYRECDFDRRTILYYLIVFDLGGPLVDIDPVNTIDCITRLSNRFFGRVIPRFFGRTENFDHLDSSHANVSSRGLIKKITPESASDFSRRDDYES